MEALEKIDFDTDTKKTKGEWTRQLTLLLIEKRLFYDDQFFKDRSTCHEGWRTILEELNGLGLSNMTNVNNIKKRYQNLYQSYKEYNKILTTNEVTWPYYDIFDNYFKNKSNGKENMKTNLQICALCLTERDIMFCNDIDEKLREKIEIYLHIKIEQNESKIYICNLCNIKLIQFDMFYRNCHNAKKKSNTKNSILNSNSLETNIKTEKFDNENESFEAFEPPEIHESNAEIKIERTEKNFDDFQKKLVELLNIEKNDPETEDLEFLEEMSYYSLDLEPKLENDSSTLNIPENQKENVDNKKITNNKKVRKKTKSKNDKIEKVKRSKKIVKKDCKFSMKQSSESNIKEPLKCPIGNCERTAYNQESLKIHVTRDHQGKNLWICAQCGRGFMYRHLLQIHEKIHFNIKDVPCLKCEEKFVSRAHLKRHVDTVHLNNFYYCSQCPKRFASKAMLNRHEIVHTGERNFECEICKKCFVTKRELKVHNSRVHLGTRPLHTCSYCYKSFTSNASKRIHERGHTGNKPYKCIQCGKCYTCTNHLNRHIKMIHKGQDTLKITVVT